MDSQGMYQTYKEEIMLIPILLKLFQKTERKELFQIDSMKKTLYPNNKTRQ